MKIGLIGLDMAVARGAASALMNGGHDLLIYDVDRSRAVALEAAGAQWAGSVAAVGAGCATVFTSLREPAEMRRVGAATGGLLDSMGVGGVWFDLTTNSPSVVREMHDMCVDHGIELFDASVPGGSPSGPGELTLFVGGNPVAFEVYATLLDVIARRIFYVGDIGAGSAAALLSECVSATSRAAVAEVIALSVKAGMDHAAIVKVLLQETTDWAEGATLGEFLREAMTATNDRAAGTWPAAAGTTVSLALELAEQFDVPLRCAHASYEDR